MQKRAQVFLIITVLVITFLIGITSLLIDTQRAAYTEPVPDSSIVFYAWDNAYDSIIQIMNIQLSNNSNAVPDSVNNINLGRAIGNLEDYFIERGISTVIQTTSSIDFLRENPGTSNVSVIITGSFYIHMQSGNVEIEENFDIYFAYNAIVDASTVVVTQRLNGKYSYISDATLSSGAATFSNNLNGVYGHTLGSGSTIDITTKNNIAISVTVP